MTTEDSLPRVLFVDDESNVLDALRRQLRREFSVEAAMGGANGLAALGWKGPFAVVVSDFLEPPGDEDWWRLLARGWDPVPVVVQDPSWEQSFPDVAGVPLPVAEVDGSRPRLVRVTRAEGRALRASHEKRFRTTLERLRSLTLEPVCIGTSDAAGVHLAFHRWAAARGGRLR